MFQFYFSFPSRLFIYLLTLFETVLTNPAQRSFTTFPLLRFPEPLMRCKHWELASQLPLLSVGWFFSGITTSGSCGVLLLLLLAVLPGSCMVWEWNSPGRHCKELTHHSLYKNIYSLRLPQQSEQGEPNHSGNRGRRINSWDIWTKPSSL